MLLGLGFCVDSHSLISHNTSIKSAFSLPRQSTLLEETAIHCYHPVLSDSTGVIKVNRHKTDCRKMRPYCTVIIVHDVEEQFSIWEPNSQ